MPICRTCRGEYSAVSPSRPSSGPSAGATAPATQPAVCPRCGSDLHAWDRLEITLPDFILWEGGILGLMPAALALAAWLFFWLPREASLYYYPILTFASFGVCVLLAFVIYDDPLSWWERWWASQVYQVRRVPIVLLVTFTALAGIFLSALWVLFYATYGKPDDWLGKVLFAFIYVLSYVCLTLAITLAILHQYILRLEKCAPPPIFTSTEKLLRVVVDAAIHDINLPGLNRRSAAGSSALDPVYEVLQTLRIPENGGIHVLLRECKRVQYPDADGKLQSKPMEMLWRVQADRWGNVQVLRPGSLEPYSAERRTFREIGRYSY